MTKKDMLADAIAFAATKHVNQVRKDQTPYIYHPFNVARIVKEAGYEIEYQIVALLHDTLEDTDAKEEEIRLYGDDVLHSVKLLTRLEGQDPDIYVEDILADPMAAVVKSADIITNMWEGAYSTNKEWAIQYIENARNHYLGKFCPAVDDAIKNAEIIVNTEHPRRKGFAYSQEDMTLYPQKG